MNTPENNSPDPVPTEARPLGLWLRVVDALLTREFASAFAGLGIDRRDWMLLNAVSGDINAPWLTERLARGGKRVRALADRGWIARTDDGWTLTEQGRAEKARLTETVDGIRSRVTAAVSPEDLATTMTSLEAIARELGWDESDPAGFARHGFGHRGHGHRRHGFAPGLGHHDVDGPGEDDREGPRGFWPRPGFGRGFGPGQGFGPGPGFGRGFGSRHGRGFGPEHDADCAPHHHRGGGRDHRSGGERAYERGFDAGFARGRDAAASHPAV